MKYTFKTFDADDIHEIKYSPTFIYQICGVPSDKIITEKGKVIVTDETNNYFFRKILVTEDNNLNIVGRYTLSKEKLLKFLKSIPENKYKIYPYKCLGDIPMPSDNDISIARSNILTNDTCYTGYARF